MLRIGAFCVVNWGNQASLTQTFFPPSIAALMPSSVPVNSVPFTVTVDGENFGTRRGCVLERSTFIHDLRQLEARTGAR